MTQHLQRLTWLTRTVLTKIKSTQWIIRGSIQKNSSLKCKISLSSWFPKIQKDFAHLPKFRSIIDTTSSTHYAARTYSSKIFQTLTMNSFMTEAVKDSFDAMNRIKSIPPESSDKGYRFVSFNVDIHTEIYNCYIKENIG